MVAHARNGAHAQHGPTGAPARADVAEIEQPDHRHRIEQPPELLTDPAADLGLILVGHRSVLGVVLPPHPAPAHPEPRTVRILALLPDPLRGRQPHADEALLAIALGHVDGPIRHDISALHEPRHRLITDAHVMPGAHHRTNRPNPAPSTMQQDA